MNRYYELGEARMRSSDTFIAHISTGKVISCTEHFTPQKENVMYICCFVQKSMIQLVYGKRKIW